MFFFFQAGREGATGLLKPEVTTFETEKVWQEVGSMEGALPLVLRADYIFFETQEHKGGGERKEVFSNNIKNVPTAIRNWKKMRTCVSHMTLSAYNVKCVCSFL